MGLLRGLDRAMLSLRAALYLGLKGMSTNVLSESQKSLRSKAIELAVLCSEEPENALVRLELVRTFTGLGELESAFELAIVLSEQFVEQGLTLLALAMLVEASEASSVAPAAYEAAIRDLYLKSSSIDESLDLDDFQTSLGDGIENRPAVTAARLESMPEDLMLDQIVILATRLPPYASRGLPLPLPLFSEMSVDTFLQALPHLRCGTIAEGDVLMRQGEVSQTICVLVDGSVNVMREGKRLARLGSGTVVGEIAFLTNAPRSATVLATSTLMFIELSTEVIRELSNNSSSFHEELEHFCHHRLLQTVVRTSPLFSHFDIPTGSMLILAFETVDLKEGDLMVENNSEGRGLWVITSGQVSVQVESESGDYSEVARLNAGDIVGEISLLKRQQTTARVIAIGAVRSLFLDKHKFFEVLEENQEVSEYLDTLSADRLGHASSPAPLELEQPASTGVSVV